MCESVQVVPLSAKDGRQTFIVQFHGRKVGPEVSRHDAEVVKGWLAAAWPAMNLRIPQP